jgi:AcrR family transcriptional regulator
VNPSFKHPSHEVSSVRAKALAAASEILAAKGVEDLNLKAIAEGAGIGISSMYHYFANKEALLLSLAVKGFDDLAEEMVRLRSSQDLPTPLAAGVRGYFGFAQAHPALFSVMFSERLMARHEILRAADHRTFLVFQSTVDADPRFPAAHKANAATALWALGRGIAAMISSQPEGKLPSELAARLWAGASYLVNHPK